MSALWHYVWNPAFNGADLAAVGLAVVAVLFVALYEMGGGR